MAEYPFFVELQEAVGANSTATLSYQVATNEQLTIKAIRQKSTGTCNITQIRDSRGISYSNADPTEALPLELFADLADANNGLLALPFDLVVPGATTIYFDLKDTSGALNTVNLILVGIRKTG